MVIGTEGAADVQVRIVTHFENPTFLPNAERTRRKRLTMTGRMLFGLAVAGLGIAGEISLVFALRSGVTRFWRFGTFRRSDDQVSFWLAIALNGVLGIFLVWYGFGVIALG